MDDPSQTKQGEVCVLVLGRIDATGHQDITKLYLAIFAALKESMTLNLAQIFFPRQPITNPSSCLHHLLPGPREQSLTSRLRTFEKYPRTYTRTRRYCSFINHSLNNYQDKMTNPQTLQATLTTCFLCFSHPNSLLVISLYVRVIYYQQRQ